MKTSFGIIGGDKRQLYLAKSIQEDGFDVCICGFELSSDTGGLEETTISALIDKCDNIILPLPCTRDGSNIFAPYSSMEICANEDLLKKFDGKNIYGGYMKKIMFDTELWKNIKTYDYYLREEFAISNAIPTAEGAIAIAIQEFPSMLNSSNCLITGYGRIGKILTKNLLAMGAKVNVAARKKEDFALIRAMGAKPCEYAKINECYDVIFNTVPETVISPKLIVKQDCETIIIELASLPGGVDRKVASLSGVRVIDAQSLPGKFAPKSSGEFEKETIYNIMEEEQC